MSMISCPSFNNIIASSVYNNLVSKSSKYYYFFGKTTPYTTVNGIGQVEVPIDSLKYELSTRKDIINIRQIKSSDISYVVIRRDWVYGKVYDHYDDSYTTSNPSHNGLTKIADAHFYVLTDNYNVYVCLDNNNNGISTIMPNGASPFPFVLSDGYKWKFVMNIPLSLRSKFLTNDHMPITNAINSSFYSNGGIDSVIINSSGEGYPSNTDAYITIDSQPVVMGALTQGITYEIKSLGVGLEVTSQINWNILAGTSGVTYIIGSVFTAQSSGAGLGTGIVGGTGAIFTPLVSSLTGEITSVKITSGGSGYAEGTKLVVVGSGSGKFLSHSTALVSPVINSGVITHVSIIDPGKGYSAPSTYLFVQSETGTGAELSAVVESGQITNIIIHDAGSGYKSANIVAYSNTPPTKDASLTANVGAGLLDTLQANIELLAIDGAIDFIKVTNGGVGYTSADVSIIGDGRDATATASLAADGSITKINITNRGAGYKHASVLITPHGAGTGIPTARVILPQKGGHGFNAIKNLFSSYLMFNLTVSADKFSEYDFNNDYRQFGIIKDPYTFNTSTTYSNISGNACYITSGTIVNGVMGDFINDYILTDTNGGRFLVVAKTNTRVMLHSMDNGVLSLGQNLVRETEVGTLIYTISELLLPEIDKYSGDMIFINNREPFVQSSVQKTTLQTVLHF